MTGFIAILRTLAVSHPLVLLVVSYGLVVWTERRPVMRFPSIVTRRGAGLLSAVAYVAIVVWYLTVPQYADHAEPSIAALSWVVADGGSPYHLANLGYAFPYGPFVYFTNAGAMLLVGPGLVSSKCAEAFAVLASLGLITLACRRTNVESAVLISTVGYLVFGYASLWVRPEPLLLFVVAGALAGLNQSRWLAAALVGLFLGVGVATKITALAYLFPAVVLLWRRHGLTPTLFGVGIALVSFALPFAISGQVTLADYAFWTRAATRHGLRWRSLPSAIEWAVLVSLPSVAVLVGRLRARTVAADMHRAGRIAFVASVLGTVFLAAKQGTGPHHFLPFIPTLAYLEAETFGARRPTAILSVRLRAAVITTAVVLAALQQAYWIPAVARAADPAAVAELQHFQGLYPGSLAVGYSSVYRQSFLRPLPVFAGQPYQLDAVALMDAEVSGDTFPRAVVDGIRHCDTRTWLIPSGGRPFELTSAYRPGAKVFSTDFVRAFHEHYRLAESGRYFDVWVCRH